jgi:membrane protease YdiL (CAAX protease family)
MSTQTEQRLAGRRHGLIAVIVVGSMLMFGILQFGPTLLVSMGLDDTVGRIVTTTVMVAVALSIEYVAFRRGPRSALRALGYGAPKARAMVVSLAVSAIMLAYFPIVSLVLGVSLTLHDNWPWLVVGAVALNGIGEETLFRGYAFGHLRASGLTFRRAALISLIIFAGVHLVLFFTNSVAVAAISVVVALAWAFPMAYLFERGGANIWAPAVAHVATHGVRFLDEPAMPVLMGWLLFQIAAPFLVFLFHRYLRGSLESTDASRVVRRVAPAGANAHAQRP